MEIQTCFTHKSTPPEKNSGVCGVDRLGYVSAQKRIENMIIAGQRLIQARREEFDFPPDVEIDESFIDPTRSLNFDPADATQLSLAYNARKAERDALKASQAAQEGSGEAVPPPAGD